MAKFKRIKSGAGEKLKLALGVDGFRANVGWFEGAKYEDGTPVAMVAHTQEFGATFMHPGGTKYIVTDGGAKFVKNSFTGDVAGVTGAHQITIPPRSFMRTTIAEKKDKWARDAKRAVKQLVKGSLDSEGVMLAIGTGASGDVRAKISSINSPPLKPGTIRGRLNKLANNKKVGSLDKPLVESSLMIDSLTNSVERA
jgi:hypothetical protein